MKRLLIVFGSSLVIIAAIIALSLNRHQTLRLVSSQPTNQNKTFSVYNPLIFTFSKPIMQSTLSVNTLSITPNLQGAITVSGNTLTFTPPDFFQSDQDYKVKLTNITGIDGQHAPDLNLSFHTITPPYNQLPPSVQQQLLNKVYNSGQLPPPFVTFVKKLPIITSTYTITYDPSASKIVVTVTANPVSQNQAAAVAYIASQGVTLTNQNSYVTSIPSLSGQTGP